ncbi:hypothetical protein MJO28_000933, partial [Puccinia striiformis f. sp. tritici]
LATACKCPAGKQLYVCKVTRGELFWYVQAGDNTITIGQYPVRFTTKAGEECWCVGGGGLQGCCPDNAIPVSKLAIRIHLLIAEVLKVDLHLKSYINGFHFKELGQKKIVSISPLYKHHHALDEMLCLRPLSSERRFWTRSCGGPEAMTSNIVGKLHSEMVIAPNELYANMNQERSGFEPTSIMSYKLGGMKSFTTPVLLGLGMLRIVKRYKKFSFIILIRTSNHSHPSNTSFMWRADISASVDHSFGIYPLDPWEKR